MTDLTDPTQRRHGPWANPSPTRHEEIVALRGQA